MGAEIMLLEITNSEIVLQSSVELLASESRQEDKTTL
jgi:hypothetical protein